MSQVLCSELEVLALLVDDAVKAIKGGAQYGFGGSDGFGDFGQSWTQQAEIGTAKEHRDLQALGGESVAISLGDALD